MRLWLAIVALMTCAGIVSPAQTLERAAGVTQSTTASAPPEPSPQRPVADWIREKMAQMQSAPTPVILAPKPGRQSFNVSGDTRTIYNAILGSFGIQVSYDEGIPTRPVRLNLQDVDFRTAMSVAGQMTRTFYVARTAKDVLVANDTPAKRRDLEPYILKTYYFENMSSPQELQDMVNLLRTVFEVRYLVPQPGMNSIEVRAPQATIDAIDRFLPTLSPRQPEVVFDVEVLEVNRSTLQNIGVDLPLQFQVFNIGAAAIAALNSPNVQNLINQLLANGGAIDPTAIAALVGQLQNQQLSALLANPVATFGGGLTLFGVGVTPATAHFERNDSRVTSIEHTTLRAQQGNAASLHIGTRLPVLTQSFSSGVQLGGIPGATIGQISGVVPGFQYEDLGMTVKATPSIHGTDSVTLNLEMSVKTAGAQQFNSVPVIQNREFKGYINVKNGESTVMAGMVSRNESRAVQGLPGLTSVPVIGQSVSTLSHNNTDSELLVIITPHIVAARETSAETIVMPKGQ